RPGRHLGREVERVDPPLGFPPALPRPPPPLRREHLSSGPLRPRLLREPARGLCLRLSAVRLRGLDSVRVQLRLSARNVPLRRRGLGAGPRSHGGPARLHDRRSRVRLLPVAPRADPPYPAPVGSLPRLVASLPPAVAGQRPAPGRRPVRGLPCLERAL